MGSCVDCGRPTVPDRRWRAVPPEDRAERFGEFTRADRGRGMCSACYRRWQVRTPLDERAPKGIPRDIVAEEWEMFHDGRLSRAANIRLIAPRIGMSEAALEKALDRLRDVAA